MFSFLRRIHPYAIVGIVLVLAIDIVGISHSFRSHGVRDGVVSVVLPPYGIYRAAEMVVHKGHMTEAEALALEKTAAGRKELSKQYQLKPEVWDVLLSLIAEQKGHAVTTMMEQGGVTYDITGKVDTKGPVALIIQSRATKDLTITMTDDNRDQVPETLQIKRAVNGKPETNTAPLAQFSEEDRSQFVLAWRLAWGTIAEAADAGSKKTK